MSDDDFDDDPAYLGGALRDPDAERRVTVRSWEEAVDLFVPAIKAAVRELIDTHGPLTPDHFRAYAILQREMGEVADGFLELTNPRKFRTDEDIEKGVLHYSHELTQVIAVCMCILFNTFGKGIEDGAVPATFVPPSKEVH